MNKIQQLTDANGNNIYPIAYAQGGMKMDLLWTNPSPSSSFSSPQTINLDIANYGLFFIYYRYQTSSSVGRPSGMFVKGVGGLLTIVTGSSEYGRTFLFSDTGVTITASTSGIETYVIPYQIYGIKMSYIVPTEVHGLQYVDDGNYIQLMNNDGTEDLFPNALVEEISTGITDVYAYKTGKTITIMLKCNTSLSVTSAAWATVGTLPSKLRPPVTIYACVYDENSNQRSTGMLQCRIVSDGRIQIYMFANESGKPRGTITYSL